MTPRIATAATALVLVCAGVAALLLGDAPAVRLASVPSFWNRVTLRCRVISLVQGDRRLEAFRCHPTNGLRPPVGVWDETNTQWLSDITRQPALRHTIQIKPSGALAGWAVY